MKLKMRKLISALLSCMLLCSLLCVPALAAGGTYSLTDFDVISKDSGSSYSSFFDYPTIADNGDGTYTIVLYAAPQSAVVWKEGTQPDGVTVHVDDDGGLTYTFTVSDISDETAKAGYEFQHDYSMPNVFDHSFPMLLTFPDGISLPDADEYSNGVAKVTGTIEEIEIPAPDYTVTVPEKIDMGTLSKSEENSQSYTVNVEAVNLDGKVEISAPGDGTLENESDASSTIAFANSFETQSVSEDTEDSGKDLSGSITVTAADAAAAAAAGYSGNYSGTTVFTIFYAANN